MRISDWSSDVCSSDRLIIGMKMQDRRSFIGACKRLPDNFVGAERNARLFLARPWPIQCHFEPYFLIHGALRFWHVRRIAGGRHDCSHSARTSLPGFMML